MLLEAAALRMFIECFTLYYQKLAEHWPSGVLSGKAVVPHYVSELVPLDSHPSANHQQVQVILEHLKAFSMSLFGFSLILLERDEHGMPSFFIVEKV